MCAVPEASACGGLAWLNGCPNTAVSRSAKVTGPEAPGSATGKKPEGPRGALPGPEGFRKVQKRPQGQRSDAFRAQRHRERLAGPRSARKASAAPGSALKRLLRRQMRDARFWFSRAQLGGQAGLVWARSGRDWPGLGQWFILVLMFYQWFTSGLPVVYSSGLLACSSCLAGRSLFFEEEQFDVQIFFFKK